MDTKTIDTIKALRSEAANFAGFHELYSAKYAPDSRCDKKGYGFGIDNRFSAFEIKTSFDSHAGYYGNSSCSTIMRVYHTDLVKPFLIKALNVHQKEIFATAARLMREEASRLTDKATAEVEAIQKMLEEAKAVLSVEPAPVEEVA
ncbi:hypothetical protein QV13_12625 [Mesorhizobium hungaricum]|jgi:hypothetical protein|uniref:Uncharacterized protein n=1 Tax=Mesorhizobium hungaricum TaxID=1566387 RepID=A0A1C2DSL1_9HYPH|nr:MULTISPECIES: hypothetical protein [Mesorhizobium]MBN9236039.1 hypothetical protein [Mesorhizobium sp.]OCX17596.1 hypothetical protein QV13_12625 [Mesorhizobium hungaricum]